jgi:hypothetical protein
MYAFIISPCMLQCIPNLTLPELMQEDKIHGAKKNYGLGISQQARNISL